ncbi:hypothetical protein EDC01DRAFT_636984 [Geopyxis carbonaria]|nr:hypothetical protein EDC01DRAFT_636984 [Geopyxis carbonaria]
MTTPHSPNEPSMSPSTTPATPSSTPATSSTTTTIITTVTTTTTIINTPPEPPQHYQHPTTVAALLEKHKRIATNDILVRHLYNELWRSQCRLPYDEVTPSIIRQRLADHAALAFAEGQRHAKDVADANEEIGSSLSEAEHALERFMKNCSIRFDGFLVDIKRAAHDARGTHRTGPEKPLKSVLRKPDAGSQGKSVEFTDPLVAVEGKGKFIITSTTLLSENDPNGRYIHYLRRPTLAELQNKVGVFEIPLKDVLEMPNGKCVRVKKADGEEVGWNVLEVRQRLSLGWGSEKMLDMAEKEEKDAEQLQAKNIAEKDEVEEKEGEKMKMAGSWVEEKNE